ncbi:MAG: DUF805 domain-containing protein [Muribaculaceae bacterium]|nr:DUF805 domain-containing protein [Muribaculaceae bacterium]MBR0023889.1 DUF805 domain-containing protein [Muribaculaceae bacterium]
MAQYYIGINNQQLGPFEVHQLLANGLTPDTLVWCSGMSSWQMARNVPELAGLFVSQQPQYSGGYQQPQYQQPQYQQPQYQQPQYGGGYQQTQYGGYQQPQYGYVDPQLASDNHLAMYGERPQVSFGDSIKICFNKFADFTGRARRSEFWWFYLFNVLVSSVSCGLGGLVCFIPMMAVSVRRLHDTGHSGWWYFIPVIISSVYMITFYPLWIYGLARGKETLITIGFIALGIFILVMLYYTIMQIIFYCRDSDPDENEYGPSPKYQ